MLYTNQKTFRSLQITPDLLTSTRDQFTSVIRWYCGRGGQGGRGGRRTRRRCIVRAGRVSRLMC